MSVGYTVFMIVCVLGLSSLACFIVHKVINKYSKDKEGFPKSRDK